MNMIEISNLSLVYPNHYVALKNINLTIPKYSRTAILGPNGAGKSSLIKAILGIEKISSGEILYQKNPLTLDIISKKIAYISQKNHINMQFPTSVYEAVLMGRYPYIHNFLKIPQQIDKEKTLEALCKMQIQDLKNRHITELSGGQLQRMFIARALVGEADLFIMDEPLAGVDIKTEDIIMTSLKTFQKEKKTSIVVHHDLNTVKKYFDYVIWINKDKIIQGTVDEVFNKENYQAIYKVADATLVDFGE